MKNIERVLGFVLILAALILGKNMLKSDMLFFRLVMGCGFGYTLTRAYMGFAGSVNRAYRTGSTKLMRTLMFLFFISCLASVAFFFKQDPAAYDLWVNPINMGLILGGILFGFGMSFSSCCASGVLTDLITGLPRALTTLVFFGMGVFLGFPVQNSASWVKESWFTSPVGEQTSGGVFLPDLFKWDGLEGYLGALVVTALFCAVVIAISYAYENRRRNDKTFIGTPMEKIQAQLDVTDSADYAMSSEKMYDRLFVKPWTMMQGAVVIAALFTILMGVTKAGWGASTPYGIWFGKLLMMTGVSADSLAAFAKMKPDGFLVPFFEHAISVQNFGIIVGTSIYLLTAGIFKKTFFEEMNISFRELLLFAMGGLSMGFGTRLSNGCNVGALYTPIANFSLSGWAFLAVMVIGGILGNKLARRLFKN